MAAAKTPTAKSYSLMTDNDGTTTGTEEIVSAQKLARAQKKDAGPTPSADAIKTWKQAVIDALAKDPRYAKETQYLKDQDWVDQTPNSGSDAFADVTSGMFYKQTPGNANASSDQVYNNYFWDSPKGNIHKPQGMAKDLLGLLDDPSWQPVTSVARVMPDGSKQAANPYTSNYVVATKTGGVGVVTDPKTGQQFVGPTDDTNPNAFGGDGSDSGEVSNNIVSNIPGGKANIQILPNTAGTGIPGYLTNDEWKEALGYMKKGWKINNRADLLVARAGGMKLLQGYWNVMHGTDQKAVGYADPASVHQGGGYVKEGSDTAHVGDQLAPLSRVGDGTSDNMNLTTGALDFYVGGIPTTPKPTTDGIDMKDKKAAAQYEADLKKWQDIQAAYNPFYTEAEVGPAR